MQRPTKELSRLDNQRSSGGSHHTRSAAVADSWRASCGRAICDSGRYLALCRWRPRECCGREGRCYAGVHSPNQRKAGMGVSDPTVLNSLPLLVTRRSIPRPSTTRGTTAVHECIPGKLARARM